MATQKGVCRPWWIRFVHDRPGHDIVLLPVEFLLSHVPESGDRSTAYQPTQIDQLEADVAQMTSLLGMAGLVPRYLQQTDARKNGSEFDVSQFFTVLEHLSMESGYTLDYVYRFDGMGGSPVLYARPLNQVPYGSSADLEAVWQSENPTASKGSVRSLSGIRAVGRDTGRLFPV